MTEVRTEAQAIEERLLEALTTIREEWDHMLPDGPPAQRPGGARSVGIVADGSDPVWDDRKGRWLWPADSHGDDSDLDRTTRVIAARQYVQKQLVMVVRTIFDEFDVTAVRLDASDIPGMCEFIGRWAARLVAESGEAEDCVERLTGCAQGCDVKGIDRDHSCTGAAAIVQRYGRPEETWSATARILTIGRCPADVGEGERKACGGKVVAQLAWSDDQPDPWAECQRCGERAVASVWERWMFPEVEVESTPAADRLLTIEEVVTLARRQFGIAATKGGVYQWVSRRRLHPVDRGAKPLTFRMGDVVEYLSERVG